MTPVNPIYAQDGLYDLLPAIYRNRDAQLGYPLRALLRAIGGQANQLAADIQQQYDNWFIETCQDELVPYFAQLVALDLGPALPATGEPSAPGAGAGAGAAVGADATWRRREVADAIADRRRKGSFSVIEQLAFDATGWPARAVEYSSALLSTRSVRFPEIGDRRLLDMGDGDILTALGTPLSRAAPLPDVRRMSSRRTPGTAQPGGVAVWLWRLVADRVRHAPARIGAEENRYSFDQLGRELALSVSPAPRAAGTAPVLDLDVPVPITQEALARRPEDYYGPGRSICIYRGGTPIPRSEIVVADLAAWTPPAEPGRVTIDPQRGRIAFPSRYPPDKLISVTYSRLIVGPIGGGAYERPLAPTPTGAAVYAVGGGGVRGVHTSIGAALAAWRTDRRKDAAATAAVIEIRDDGVYEEHLSIDLVPGEQLVIRAAEGCRPVVIPIDDREDYPDRLLVSGREHDEPPKRGARGRRGAKPPADAEVAEAAEPETTSPPAPGPAPRLTLDGLWIGGAPLELAGRLGPVTISHCTLVPASGAKHLEGDRDRRAASLIVKAMPCPISVSASVVGRIEVESPEAGFDPLALRVCDSVLDAARLDRRAIEGADGRRAFVSLRLQRATVLGSAEVHDVTLVENSIITGPLLCERRQSGEVRFSYVPLHSRTPRRTRCQPDSVRAAIEASYERGAITRAALERDLAHATERVTPRFDAVVFGAPAYARLAEGTAGEIVSGADDEGELGVYHDLWQALGISDLSARLREFSPAGIDIGLRFSS